MDRKAVAQETLEIMRQGYYYFSQESSEGSRCLEKRRIEIEKDMTDSLKKSRLFSPEQGRELLLEYEKDGQKPWSPQEIKAKTRVENLATVAAIRRLQKEGKAEIGVLNFASAKNPGGGFLNGAMAQEESLAASSTLYRALIRHEEYYRQNRSQSSMMYTDYGIYAPDVVFFRDEAFGLVEDPVKASVLTLPAVNMGQVLQKREDLKEAERVMRRRMKLALCIFARQGAKHLVLGAYGCGVFRNDPRKVALWWQELLQEELGGYFDSVFHAVLDRSRSQECIRAFEETFSVK